jgi:hypothetical protein
VSCQVEIVHVLCDDRIGRIVVQEGEVLQPLAESGEDGLLGGRGFPWDHDPNARDSPDVLRIRSLRCHEESKGEEDERIGPEQAVLPPSAWATPTPSGAW